MSEDNSSERADLNQLVLDLAPHGESVAQLFKNELARAPWIVWSPERRDISHPLARRFYDRCETLPAGEGGIAEADVDLDHFGSLADWMTVVRVDPDSGQTDVCGLWSKPGAIYWPKHDRPRASDFGHSNSDFICRRLSGRKKPRPDGSDRTRPDAGRFHPTVAAVVRANAPRRESLGLSVPGSTGK